MTAPGSLSTGSATRRPTCLAALLMLALLTGCAAPTPPTSAGEAARLDTMCASHGAGLLAARNELETARTYLRASKDNFGPGRDQAIEATEQAIAALQALAPVQPDPDTKLVRFVGTHRHPRMQYAFGALRDARAALNQLDCFAATARAPVGEAIDCALAAIVAAFQVNAPGSGS